MATDVGLGETVLIIAAGLTPAWQQIVLLERLKPGEVNRAREVHWCASGKVLNVGIALGHLGADAKTLALIGGTTGQAITAEFTKLGFAEKWIHSAAATRVCTTILAAETGVATELVENAPPVAAHELDLFRQVFAETAEAAEIVILAGSLPAGAPEGYYLDLMINLRARTIIDGRGPELLSALTAKPFLVKPNREELARTVGRKFSGERDLIDGMRALNRRGARWVLVTQGAGAVWLASQTKCYRFGPPQMTPVNPIGSGDSMAAGIAWALTSNDDILRAVKIGIAAGVENAMQLLPARLNPESVLARAETVTCESYR